MKMKSPRREVWKEHRYKPLELNEYLIDPKYGIYTEEYFNKRLSFETKRTERSQRPILMMLLNIEKVLNVDGGGHDILRIKSVLFSAVRTTDIKGWHRFNATLGVLFTEMNGIDKNLIKKKIYHGLCDALEREKANKIELSFHVFPGERHDLQKGSPLSLDFYPDLSRPKASRGNALFFKRAMDIVGSVLGIILFCPVFLIVSILVKLFSKGPILYKQERVGLHGKKFTFLKFRTMHVNNDPQIHKEFTRNLINGRNGHNGINGSAGEAERVVYKITNDPRVTPIGRILRSTSLDEFPQFFNVLKGEMSLVGPRPPIPYEVEDYDIWHRRRVLEVKPGITGLWQVEGRSSTTFDEMVRLDLTYVRKWSIWLDLKILLQTPWVVIAGKGAR